MRVATTGGGAAMIRVLRQGERFDPDVPTRRARHEGGTPNLIGAVALAAACCTLTGIGWEAEHGRAAGNADRGTPCCMGLQEGAPR